MRAIQEAYLDLLSQGLDKSEACRRLCLGRSQPGYWASTSPEFEKAYRPYRGQLQKSRINIDVVHELAELLVAQGHVEAAYINDMHSLIATFFMRIGALSYPDIKLIVNRCALSLAEQRTIIDGYIKLKK